jgi:hypothetical protein
MQLSADPSLFLSRRVWLSAEVLGLLAGELIGDEPA